LSGWPVVRLTGFRRRIDDVPPLPGRARRRGLGQLGLHQKPCGVLNVRGYFDGLLSFIEHSIDECFVRREYRSMVIVSSSADSLLERFDQYIPLVVPKWIDAAAT
jgi:predicted Rossmann-fold nucleotide-binding protein